MGEDEAPDSRPGVSANDGPGRPRRPSLLTWLWPVRVGLVFGAIVLAPFARSPGDPSGHGIAAGVGGIFGLIVALVVRAVLPRRTH